ncbi:hypothetical protein MMPV_009093 [Pyropia vietnamensis]
MTDGPRCNGGGASSTVAATMASSAALAAAAATETVYGAHSQSLPGQRTAAATTDDAPGDRTAAHSMAAELVTTIQNDAPRRVENFRRLESLDSSDMLVIVADSIPDRDLERESVYWEFPGATHVRAPTRCFSFSSDGADDKDGENRTDGAHRGSYTDAFQYGSPMSTEAVENADGILPTQAVPTSAAAAAAATAGSMYGSGEDHGGGWVSYTCRPPPSAAVPVPTLMRNEGPSETAAQWALNGDGYAAMEGEEGSFAGDVDDFGALGSGGGSLYESADSAGMLQPWASPIIPSDGLRLTVEPTHYIDHPMEDSTSSHAGATATASTELPAVAASRSRPPRSCPRPSALNEALEATLSAMIAASGLEAWNDRTGAVARMRLPPAAAAVAADSTARHKAVIVAAGTDAAMTAVATLQATRSAQAGSSGGCNACDSGDGAGPGPMLMTVADAVAAAARSHLKVWRQEVDAAAAAVSATSRMEAAAPLSNPTTSAEDGGAVATGRRTEADQVAAKRHSADVYEAALLAAVPPAVAVEAENAAAAARLAVVKRLKDAKAEAAAAEAAATAAESPEGSGMAATAEGATAEGAGGGRACGDDRWAMRRMVLSDKNRLANNRISAAGTRAARATRVAFLRESLQSGVWRGVP